MNKHNMAIRVFQNGDQGVPDQNGDVDFGFGAGSGESLSQ